MVWVIVGASLAVVALAAIGYFAFGVFRAVKDLSKDLARTSKLLADAAAPVQNGTRRAPAGNGSRPGRRPADR